MFLSLVLLLTTTTLSLGRTVYQARSDGTCEARGGPTTFGEAGAVPSSALGNNPNNDKNKVDPTVPYVRRGWLNIATSAECVDAMKSFEVSSVQNDLSYMGGYGGFYQAASCGSNQRNSHDLCDIGDLGMDSQYDVWGCFASGRELYFNTGWSFSTAPSCHTTHNQWCLCKFEGNNCADGSGATTGSSRCICGAGDQASVCTEDTGYYCNAAYHFCSFTPVQSCAKSNTVNPNPNEPIVASEANTGSCGCGQIKNGMSACTPLTGLHCHLGTKQQGFCSRAKMTRTYVEVTSGTCKKHGYQTINTRIDCEAAATYKLWSTTKAWIDHQTWFAGSNDKPTHYPRECWLSIANNAAINIATRGGLIYASENSKVFQGGDCSGAQLGGGHCICGFDADVCKNTDGSSPNSAPCICNGVLCSTSSGLLCDVNAVDRCSTSPTCAQIDNNVGNAGVCLCSGSATGYAQECTSSSGFLCNSPTVSDGRFQCTHYTACPNTDGTIENMNLYSCKCGHISCEASQKFCYVDGNGVGTCSSACPVGQYKSNGWCGKYFYNACFATFEKIKKTECNIKPKINP